LISSLFRKKERQKKALVLMYHRIADETRDPWELAVSPEHFEQQLQALQDNYPLISVPQLVEQLNNKTIEEDAVCLSFDDGYSDNFGVANPLLQKFNVPATFFIPTKNLGAREPFWWDELEWILFDTNMLPGRFGGNINGQTIEMDLGDETVLSALLVERQNQWAWPQHPPTKRVALYFKLWENLKPLPYPQLQAAMKELRQWANASEFNKPALLPMTVSQLQEMASHPLFHIGIHTVSHPALSAHSFAVQKEELDVNQKELVGYGVAPIPVVAFPYGDYNETTLSVVKDLHLSAAFCTKETPVTNHSNITNLGRFQVKNWNKKEFEKRMLDWFKIR
jgi:peptidoglycan/xylan/chitin deacetylase (PgdA/CDA1 family)